jgi:hypothetical protein
MTLTGCFLKNPSFHLLALRLVLLTALHSSCACSMILGRAVKNEYLTLATLGALGAVVALTTGGDKAKPQPTTLQQVKEAVKIGAGSRSVPATSPVPSDMHG